MFVCPCADSMLKRTRVVQECKLDVLKDLDFLDDQTTVHFGPFKAAVIEQLRKVEKQAGNNTQITIYYRIRSFLLPYA
jgi:hypothetical protein